jgi:hypothetical protein
MPATLNEEPMRTAARTLIELPRLRKSIKLARDPNLVVLLTDTELPIMVVWKALTDLASLPFPAREKPLPTLPKPLREKQLPNNCVPETDITSCNLHLPKRLMPLPMRT